jgi:Holliday junction resolvase RusA-like endonuclease
MAFEVTVFGKAQPAGSKKAFVIPGTNRASVSDANTKAKPWKGWVAQTAGEAWGDRPLLDAALAVRFRFFIPRPKGHYRTDGVSLSAQGRRMPHPTKKPDVLKLARGVEDALTGVIYRDDADIVHETLTKEWGEPARVEIKVTEFTSEQAEEPSSQGALPF